MQRPGLEGHQQQGHFGFQRQERRGVWVANTHNSAYINCRLFVCSSLGTTPRVCLDYDDGQ